MDREISGLEAHLGYWLRFVSNRVSQGFAEKLAGRGVSVAEWVVLRLLFDAPAAPSAVAGRMGMTRGAITKLADRLIARGLLVRSAGSGDRRTQSLALTDAGRALVPELAALADANDAEFFGFLTAAERWAVEAVMRRIVERRGLIAVPVD